MAAAHGLEVDARFDRQYPVTVNDAGRVATAAQVVRFHRLYAGAPGTVPAPQPAPNVVPTASFTVSADALVAAFDGSASADSDGTVKAWAWDFGDGGTSTAQKPNHTFADAGSYPVTLTAKNASGSATRRTTEQDTSPSFHWSPASSPTIDK